MHYVRYGGKSGKRVSLVESNDLVATRTRDARLLDRAVKSRAGVEALSRTELVAAFPEAGVEVHRVTATKSIKSRNR